MDMRYRLDYKEALDSLVSGMPGVRAEQAFGYPAYKVNGRVFAFVGSDGIAVKVPASRAQSLIKSDPVYAPFEPIQPYAADEKWLRQNGFLA